MPALLALTRRADSLFAMRLLILRLSVSVNAVESGSPLYAIGRPAFFFLGPYRARAIIPAIEYSVAGMQPFDKLGMNSGQHKSFSYHTKLEIIRARGGAAGTGLDPTAQARTRAFVLFRHLDRQDNVHLRHE